LFHMTSKALTPMEPVEPNIDIFFMFSKPMNVKTMVSAAKRKGASYDAIKNIL